VHEALKPRHDVLTASRSRGRFTVDIRDPPSIAAIYQEVGRVDAVARAAGSVPYKPLTEQSNADLQAGVADKLFGQVELVRQGTDQLTDEGSFTLITGILARHPIRREPSLRSSTAPSGRSSKPPRSSSRADSASTP
jgi:NADP-dependent 3-hydroxy acid dehydrogenase YdfG